jgi:hypothetical protein
VKEEVFTSIWRDDQKTQPTTDSPLYFANVYGVSDERT